LIVRNNNSIVRLLLIEDPGRSEGPEWTEGLAKIAEKAMKIPGAVDKRITRHHKPQM
jgi:hypothetical protein